MPQGVWRDSCLDRGLAQATVENPPDAAVAQSAAPQIQEQRAGVDGPGAQRTRRLDPLAQRSDRLGADGYHALLRSLAEHPHHPGVQIDVVEIEPDQLADPKTGGVQELQDRAVANRAGVGLLDAIEQREDLVDRQLAGELLGYFGCLHRGRRVDLEAALADRVVEKGAHGGELSRYRRLAKSVAAQVCDESAYRQRVDLLGPGGRSADVLLGKVDPELAQVVLVRPDGLRGHVPLVAEVGEKGVDGLVIARPFQGADRSTTIRSPLSLIQSSIERNARSDRASRFSLFLRTPRGGGGSNPNAALEGW